MSKFDIFDPTDNDDTTVALLKETLAIKCNEYKRMLKRHSSEETTICTYNHLQIEKKFKQITNLRESILELVDHDGKFIEL